MNSVNNIDLSKIRKCDQVWDDMPENEKGNICLKCEKNIIDFRNKTKAEIAKAHVFSESNLCGIYNEKQVSSPTLPINKRIYWYHPRALYLAFLGLLSSPALAQSNDKNKRVEQTVKPAFLNFEIQNLEAPKQLKEKDIVLISGKIIQENGESIPVVNVVVKGSKEGTTSDFDGNFQLNVPVDSTKEIVLVFKSFGFRE